eukprot:gene1952-3790_t
MSSSLEILRKLLDELNITAFIVGSSDAHQSEYVPECDERREFISGFTGSAGTALITLNKAFLWTDGRYFLQAAKELSPDWTLMRSGDPGVLELDDWLCANLSQGQKIGVDPLLISTSAAQALVKKLEPFGISLEALASNPVDQVWGAARPKPPCTPVKVHDMAYAGISYQDKIKNIRNDIKLLNADSMVISMLDEIAWLFNIRGADVKYNPVVVSYAIITSQSSHLFVNSNKIGHVILHHLSDVQLHCYDEIESFLTSQRNLLGKILIDPAQLNWKLYNIVQDCAIVKPSPVTLPKSLKNKEELDSFRDCHVRDGAALTAFLHWLETSLTTGSSSGEEGVITEYLVTRKIEEFRGRDPRHVFPSFGTIAGYGSNGLDSLFLLDSGAQYLDGTTDVTRTLHFGTPNEHMKTCFTLVLKGHIALGSAVFPQGTVGSRLDTLARLPLWSMGLDYNHGTGHGVGAYLNVHEGPQGISHRVKINETGFQSGMTISNEPGYYEENAFGIRIESLCITIDANTTHNFAGKKFCTFETVTMTPIQKKLIRIDMLDDKELHWLNEYHTTVRKTLLPIMQERFPEAVPYLICETEILTRN